MNLELIEEQVKDILQGDNSKELSDDILKVMYYFYKFNYQVGKFEYKPDKEIIDTEFNHYDLVQKEILLLSEDIYDVNEKLWDNFLEKYLKFEYSGKLFDFFLDGFRNQLEFDNFNTIKEQLKKQILKINEMYEISLNGIVSEKKSMIIKGIHNFEKDHYITSVHNVSNYRALISETINKSISHLKKNTLADEHYINLLNDLKYIWTNAVTKKKPNKVYSAFENLLKYNKIKDGMIWDLYLSFISIYKDFESIKDTHVVMIMILRLAFENEDNKSYKNSIKSLATAEYENCKIIDPRTFDKKYNS